jgi:hypothetical protein
MRGQALDVSVTCEGHREMRSRQFHWELHGFHCNGIDLGDLVVERATP